MVTGNFGTLISRGALGAFAALLLSTAVMADDSAAPSDPTIAEAGTVSDAPVQNWHALNPGTVIEEDGQGIAVGEPDPSGATDPAEGDGGDENWVDDSGDGSDVSLDDPADEPIDAGLGDPEVYIQTMGGPDGCIDCMTMGPVLPAAMPGSISVAAKGDVKRPRHPVVSVANVAAFDVQQCRADHPKLMWLCGWPVGADQ